MKFYLLLLLLLPACAGTLNEITCFGGLVSGFARKKLCKAPDPVACYSKNDRVLGCDSADICKKSGVKCCYTDLCNKQYTFESEAIGYEIKCYVQNNDGSTVKSACQSKDPIPCFLSNDGSFGCDYGYMCKQSGVECCYMDYCNKPKVEENNNGKLFEINCYARFVGEEAQKTFCRGPDRMACYSKKDGELGCYDLADCEKPGVHCCHVDYCNKPLDAF